MPSLPAFLVATLLELAVLCALVGLSRGSEVRVSPKLRPTDFGDFETSCLTDVAANLAEVVWVERVDLSSVYRHVPWAVPPRPFRMLLKRDNDYISEKIGTVGAWEPGVTAAILHGLSAATLHGAGRGGAAALVDVGTHVGWHTVVAALAGHPVVGIEPFWRNRVILEATVSCLNPHLGALVHVEPVALSDRSDTCMLRYHEDFSLNTQLYCESDGVPPCEPPLHTEGCMTHDGLVDVTTLDALASSGRLPLDRPMVLKIDAEGRTLRILHGGAALLAGPRAPLLIEAELEGPHIREAVDLLQAHGYVLLTRMFTELPRCGQHGAPWRWEAVRLMGDYELDILDILRESFEATSMGVAFTFMEESFEAAGLAGSRVRAVLGAYEDAGVTLKHQGPLYHKARRALEASLQMDVIFAKESLLPFLPGALQVKEMGRVTLQQYAMLGDDLSAALGPLLASTARIPGLVFRDLHRGTITPCEPPL